MGHGRNQEKSVKQTSCIYGKQTKPRGILRVCLGARAVRQQEKKGIIIWGARIQ